MVSCFTRCIAASRVTFTLVYFSSSSMYCLAAFHSRVDWDIYWARGCALLYKEGHGNGRGELYSSFGKGTGLG